MKRTLHTILLLCLCFLVEAQHGKGTLQGRILSADGEPASFVPVGLKGTKIGTSTDEHGKFKLHVPEGVHTLLVQLVGHQPEERQVEVKAGETTVVPDFTLRETAHELHEVEVLGKTETQEVRESSYNVNAIDAKPLHNTSQDINQVLNKTAGVRVREEGGMGSAFNFSLNGFSGRQVRFFLDGIPMDNFGSSLTLNNIPINLAERIEVYKGVIPIWLGADALGGAVNIVTNHKMKNFLDASYSYGSFNTHRTSVNLGYTNKKNGFAVFANAFQNYSDNNYWVDIQSLNFTSNQIGNTERVRRFHDRYRSETFQIETGIVGKKWADKLLFGIILSQSDKQIQTAAQMSKVYGQRAQNSTTLMPTFKYKKSNLFVKGLDFNLYATYNFGSTTTVDTVNRIYNWRGEFKDNSRDKNGMYVPGAEDSRSLYTFQNHLFIGNANWSYQFHPSHSVGLNYTYSSFDRTGSDPLKPNEEAYTKPQILRKTAIGIGYKFDFRKRWSTSIFTKQYFLEAISAQRVDIYTNPRWVTSSSPMNRNGLGIATSVFVTHYLQVKGSYENTYRMPEGDEMFGDGINNIANKNLRPEQSNNLNVGFVVSKQWGSKHKLVFESNFLYRQASDFIRTDLLDNRTQSVNVRDIENTGFDADIRYSYDQRFHIGVNGTYQTLINTAEFESDEQKVVSPIYLDQIPNVPYLFGNVDAGARFDRVGFAHAKLGISYNLLFVEEYYLKWPSLGYSWEKNTIPRQISHNLSATYSLKDGKYNVSVECRNFTDTQMFDNFLMQKPGRAFYVKLRYFFNK